MFRRIPASREVIALLAIFTMATLYAPGARAADDERSAAFDKRFVKEASQYSYAMNEISRLAAEKSNSEGVKHYAQLMIGGQKKLIDDLRDIAQRKDYKLSEELTDKQRQTRQRLSELEGTNFDVQYMSNEVENQEALYRLFGHASKTCQDPDLRAYAERRLPAIREHLENAKDLYRKVKGKER